LLADVYIQKPPHQYPFREPPQSLPKGKTTVDDIDLRQMLAEPHTAAHPDVLRELLSKFIQTLLGATTQS
jgi:hypothetical protein